MKKDEKRSRMVNFRLSEMEYESFKNNVVLSCGCDNGAVSRYLRERIFTETYDIRLLRSLCSSFSEMKAKLDHELKVASATGETSALQRLLEDNVHYLSLFQEKLSSAIDNSPQGVPMAITKITNIKANLTGHGARSAHLINALSYIMNKDKTDNGLLIGSNCGSDPKECYDRMMETKRFYGKENGRQGYHVVISFKPHEGTKDLAYRIGQEFCERIFGND